MKSFFIFLILVLSVFYSPGQSIITLSPSPESCLPPLFIYKNGPGKVAAQFSFGQLFMDGRYYHLIAVPDRGYEFSNWQEVDVFTVTQYLYFYGQRIEPPIISTDVTPVPHYIYDPLLLLPEQKVDYILSSTNVMITESIGWQANFVPGGRW